MTGNILIDLLISVAGIIGIVSLIRWLFPETPASLTKAQCVSYLQLQEPDFIAIDWLLDDSGHCLLCADQRTQEYIVLTLLGGDIIHRRFFQSDVEKIDYTHNSLILRLSDPVFSTVEINAEQASSWYRRIGRTSGTLTP